MSYRTVLVSRATVQALSKAQTASEEHASQDAMFKCKLNRLLVDVV